MGKFMISWECVIKNVEDDQNILVTWVADGKENRLNLADLCATSLKYIIFFQYDKTCKRTIRQKQKKTIGSKEAK